MALLLDFYGDLLSERRKAIVSAYYEEDLSLSEVAEQMGITRQGVRDSLQKSEQQLRFYEEKLGLVARFDESNRCLAQLIARLEAQGRAEDLPLIAEARQVLTANES